MMLKQQADALLQRAVAAGEVPGVVATVTDRQGTLYEGAFGKRRLGAEAPMTVDTVGLIASMTKALTSTAALQLLEQGRLTLDQPAVQWLPELEQIEVLEGFDAQGQPRTRAPRRPITLRHLLTHTAGFSYEFLSEEVQKFQAAKGLKGIFSGELAELRVPLLFDPGERWHYGINTDWVGRVVEAVSGQTLGAYLRQHLLEPLGMNDTAFRITPPMRERLAAIHQRDAEGKLVAIDLEGTQEPQFESGGGGLYSTAPDYLKFLRLILNRGRCDGGQLLKPETVDLMSSNQMGELDVLTLRSANRGLTNDLVMPPEIPHKWGLAWMINTKKLPTRRPAGSLSWAGLTNCYYWIDLGNGIGGVYLTQILPFADVKSMPLYFAFEYTVYSSLAKS
jgi:methyl acetate hydrolase